MNNTRIASAWLLAILLGGSTLAYAAAKRPVHKVDSDYWTNEFDTHFRKYAKRYFGPGFDWRWFKAQGIAESGLKQRARSHVGAVGIMQLLPSTFKEIRRSSPSIAAINEPRWNIAAGIFYDRAQYRKFRQKLPSRDRLLMAFSSYNAGYGRVLKATRRHKGKLTQWKQLAPLLPQETRGYIARIGQLMGIEPNRLGLIGLDAILERR